VPAPTHACVLLHVPNPPALLAQNASPVNRAWHWQRPYRSTPHGVPPALQETILSAVQGRVQNPPWHVSPARQQVPLQQALAQHPFPHGEPKKQSMPHVVPSQVATAKPSGVGHGSHRSPQCSMLLLSTQAVSQRWKPSRQGNSQPLAPQTASAFSGGVPQQMLAQQAVGQQAPLHSTKPSSQVKPQDVPSQVAVALSGTGHGSQRSPQCSMPVLSTQVLPQACRPGRKHA
jgi:hypothetical protein